MGEELPQSAETEDSLGKQDQTIPGHVLRELHRRLESTSSAEDQADAEVPSHALERLTTRTSPAERYRVLDEIARGGQGTVLRVWDEDLRRNLAMKLVLAEATRALPEGANTDDKTLGRFLEEAQVTGQLDHPSIVPVHELGVDAEGRAYFTMKLVRGQDLRQIFKLVRTGEEGWSKMRALGALLKVCEALSYAHDKGVIHRDLKPGNIMVGRYGEVMVMDWGLARIVGKADQRDIRIRSGSKTSEPLSSQALSSVLKRAVPDDSPLVTMDGDVVGTPAYMPPEQAAGDIEAMGPHSDVYSLGAMLYELITGQRPYMSPGVRANNYVIWYLVQAGPPTPLAELAPRESPELVAICEKAMAREPFERYRDMSELAADLSAFLEGRVVRAYETGAFAELRKWVSRNKGLAAASVLAGLATVSGLASVSYVQAARRQDAEKQSAVAKQNEDRANMERANVLRLSAFQKLQDLKAEADSDGFWPALPEKIPEYEDWMLRAEELLAGLHGGPSWDGHYALREMLRERIQAREGSEAAGLEGEGDRWWYGQVQKLIGDLEAFASEDTGLMYGLSPEHDWGVGRRLRFARSVLEESLLEVETDWQDAIASIRDPEECPAYGGLEIKPQLGLVPLGPDPESGLWEFLHIQSGGPPEYGAEGMLLTDEAGLVFVLIPGGTFWMGAQNNDPEARNYDPHAIQTNAPVHQVELDPYFLSKYEMTQSQWRRFVGEDPSTYSIAGGINPVENVSWIECLRVVRRMGLDLPTEAQWEYAARAGTNTVWWTGNDRESLRTKRAANLADQAAAEAGQIWTSITDWPELHDRFGLHAPVHEFAANGFGLHNVHGNVWEWCLDAFVLFENESGPVRNPLADPVLSTMRVVRGGAYLDTAANARIGNRATIHNDYRSFGIGLRPARALE